MTPSEQLKLKAQARLRLKQQASGGAESAVNPDVAMPWYTPLTYAPENAYNMGRGMIEAVRHPLDTLNGLTDLTAGASINGWNAVAPESMQLGLNDYGKDLTNKASAFGHHAYESLNTPTRAWNTIATHPIDTLMMFAPGVGQMGKVAEAAGMARTGSALAKTAEFTNPVNMVGKTYNEARNFMLPTSETINARKLGVSKSAFRDVGQSLDNITAARSYAASLGPDAMAAHLTPQATQDARALAAMSLKDGSSAELSKRAQFAIDNSGNRAAADWQRVVGPAMSRFDKTLNITKQKLSASSPYEAAKALEIDATPVYNLLPKAAEKMKFNAQASSNIDELHKMVTDQYKGNDRLHNAGDLMAVRQRLDEMIRSAGSGQTVTPGVDLYQLGSHTQTGRALMEIRKTINETLHSDPRLAIADSIFAGAEKQKSAFELGNKKIIGSGDNAIEPQLLAKQFQNMPAEAKRSLLEGLARKGQTTIGDVRPNRNEGKAMADAFATPNNLARLDAMGLDSARVKNMAAREDALASGSNRILGGSDTARTDIAKSKYGASGGIKDYLGNGLIGAGLTAGGYALHAANPLLALLLGSTGFGAKKLIDMARISKAAGSAKLLSSQGPALEKLLQALEDAKIPNPSKTKKFNDKDLIKSLIVGRALTSYEATR